MFIMLATNTSTTETQNIYVKRKEIDSIKKSIQKFKKTKTVQFSQNKCKRKRRILVRKYEVVLLNSLQQGQTNIFVHFRVFLIFFQPS